MPRTNAEKEMARAVSRILRDAFGKGPQASHVSIGDRHIIVFLKAFLSPMEENLLQAEGEDAIHSIRESMMKDVGPEVRRSLQTITGEAYNEFFYDWNLSNRTGVLIGLKPHAFQQAGQSKQSDQNKDPLYNQYARKKRSRTNDRTPKRRSGTKTRSHFLRPGRQAHPSHYTGRHFGSDREKIDRNGTQPSVESRKTSGRKGIILPGRCIFQHFRSERAEHIRGLEFRGRQKHRDYRY